MKTSNAISCIPAIRIFLAVLLLARAPDALQAQLVPDGGTTNITTAINLPGNLTVGTNGGNTTVNIIGPGGALSNAFGYVGLNASSSSNSVVVQNSGALWRNSGDLVVGESGNGNQLIVSNGAVAANRLYAGKSGSGNRLIVSGGTLTVTNGCFVGGLASSSNNQAIITGPGSLWTNVSFLSWGIEGGGNQLVVSNGATVTATDF